MVYFFLYRSSWSEIPIGVEGVDGSGRGGGFGVRRCQVLHYGTTLLFPRRFFFFISFWMIFSPFFLVPSFSRSFSGRPPRVRRLFHSNEPRARAEKKTTKKKPTVEEKKERKWKKKKKTTKENTGKWIDDQIKKKVSGPARDGRDKQRNYNESRKMLLKNTSEIQ